MSTTYCFCEQSLLEALLHYAPVVSPPDQPEYQEIVRKSAERMVLAFLHSPAAAKLRVTPSPSPGGLSPEGAYLPATERIA